jgi:hypothetical protein
MCAQVIWVFGCLNVSCDFRGGHVMPRKTVCACLRARARVRSSEYQPQNQHAWSCIYQQIATFIRIKTQSTLLAISGSLACPLALVSLARTCICTHEQNAGSQTHNIDNFWIATLDVAWGIYVRVCVSFSHYRDLTVGQFLTYFSFVVMLFLILFPANRGQTADPQVWHFLVWGYGMGNSDRSLYFWLCGIGCHYSQRVLPMPETHTN